MSDNALINPVDISSNSNGTPVPEKQVRRQDSTKLSNPLPLNNLSTSGVAPTSNFSVVGSPQMRMRQQNPIQGQNPPQIDFSELQLKNFNQ